MAAEKREIQETEQKGLQIGDLVLVAVLLAAGAVLKLIVGLLFTGGVKPNFIIASYCLALLLIKPRSFGRGALYGLIIGLIAGAICQIPILNGTPLLNFVSEGVAGVVMGLIAAIPAKEGNRMIVRSFIATLVVTFISGAIFSLLAIVVRNMDFMAGLIQNGPIVIGTAIFNAVIVAILIVPLRLALKKN